MSLIFNQGKSPMKLTSNEELIELYQKKQDDNRSEIQTLIDSKDNYNIKIIQDSNTFITEKKFNKLGSITGQVNPIKDSNVTTNPMIVNKILPNEDNLFENKLKTNTQTIKKDESLNISNISYNNMYLDKIHGNKSKTQVKDNSEFEKDKNQSNSYNPTISTKVNNSNNIYNESILSDNDTQVSFIDFIIEKDERYNKFKEEYISKW